MKHESTGPYYCHEDGLSTNRLPESFIEPPIAVTDEFFREANKTPEVDANLEAWNENRAKGNLTAAVLCGDARVYIPEEVARRTTSIRTLGAGGDAELKGQYSRIMNGGGVSSVAFLGHYDGLEFAETHVPGKCGITDQYGLQSKSDEPIPLDGYKDYAQKHIRHADPVMQAIYSSLDAIEMTDKPVGGFALCHRTGESNLVGYFHHPKNGGYTLETNLNPIYFDKTHYDPIKIYRDGMISISGDQLERIPDELIDYYQEWNEAMRKIRIDYASRGIDYRKALEVQNPSIISLSTDPRPLGLIYRLGPNTAFKLRVPRTSIEDDEVIEPDKLKQVLNQAHYPIAQNIHNFENPDAPFSNTHTLLIQTKSMEKSRNIAHVAMGQEHVQEWLHLPDSKHPHQIIIAQMHRGKLTQVETYARSN